MHWDGLQNMVPKQIIYVFMIQVLCLVLILFLVNIMI